MLRTELFGLRTLLAENSLLAAKAGSDSDNR
jgi:hypothetical protein